MATMLLSVDFSKRISLKQTHYHDSHQILFITGGSADICVNNTINTVSAGDLIVFSRLEHHAVTNQSEDYQRYILELAPNFATFCQNAYQLHSVLFNRPVGFSNILNVRKDYELFYRLFKSIYEEMQNTEPMCGDMVDLIVQQLLIAIYRRMPQTIEVTESNRFKLVYQIQTLFHTDFHKQFDLHSIAQEYNISVSYLAHLFKATTGCSVLSYLQSCRIAEAKKCLTDGKMRINEIVEHCGFSDCSNFSRTFRKITGLSPTEFRAQFHKVQ